MNKLVMKRSVKVSVCVLESLSSRIFESFF